MIILWNIRKKTGHLRPKLWYRIRLDPFEVALAVPMIRIASTIPKPPDAWRGHVPPTALKDGREETTAHYDLCSPSHQTGTLAEVLTLPMRLDNHYPEVEESFLALRRAYEQALVEAYENRAFEEEGRLEMSPETKRRIAPGVAASRFLEVLGVAS